MPEQRAGGHPLEPVIPLLRETLVSIADEAEHRMIVTDADGRVLWLAPPGGVHPHHRWTGAACPVHDPDTGDVVGAVDVSGQAPALHPTTLALVVAAARLAEGHLRTQLALRDERLLTRNLPHLSALHGGPGALLTTSGRVLAAQPVDWLPARVTLPGAGDRVLLGELGEGLLEPLAEGFLLRVLRTSAVAPLPVLTLRFLGPAPPTAGVLRLSPAHASLLTLLALHPDGLTADELAVAHGGEVAVAAELTALGALLPPGILLTGPYRLHARVDADFLQVRTALADGRVRDAARAYRGPLLPRSDAPGIRQERDLLAADVRRAVLDSHDHDAMWALSETSGADDVELAQRLHRALPAHDPRRSALSARMTITP